MGGIILATEYDVALNNTESNGTLYQRLHRLIEIAKGHHKCSDSEQYFQRANHFNDLPNSSSTASSTSSHQYILLFLHIPSSAIEVYHNKKRIHSIVAEVSDIMATCVNEIDPPTAWKFQWFVQPVPHITSSSSNNNNERKKKRDHPQQGFLAGLNWLIRAMSEQEHGEI